MNQKPNFLAAIVLSFALFTANFNNIQAQSSNTYDSAQNLTASATPNSNPESKSEETEGSTNNPFDLNSRIPQFPGGDEAMQAVFAKKINYPELSRKNCAEGTVKVRVTILPDGQPTDFQIIQSSNKELDKVALEAVKAMPNWEPALQHGLAVKCKVIVPVHFSLH